MYVSKSREHEMWQVVNFFNYLLFERLEFSIGVFPKMEQEFSEFSEFRESNKSLKHELNWIQRSCLSCVSFWCSGNILVSYTGGSRLEPFYCNDKYFCHWIPWIQWQCCNNLLNRSIALLFPNGLHQPLKQTENCHTIVLCRFKVVFCIAIILWPDRKFNITLQRYTL